MSSGGGLSSAVTLSHLLLREKVRPGDRAVDATCGNGNDTLFLAGLVAPSGRVWAFDIQERAIATTRELLSEAGLVDSVELIHSGHERIKESVDGSLRAAVFNLGYLPGGDKSRITRPDTTLSALQQASSLLLPGGVLVVVVYPGHPGGEEESRAVDSWAEALPAADWHVWRSCQLNRPSSAPYLLCAEKMK